MVFAARAAAHPAAEELLLIPTYPDHPPDDDEATRTYIIVQVRSMSKSDLLPLVAAALNDQVAADAAKDLSTAREERDRSHKVEVLRSINNGEGEDEDGETIVYGSALIEDGRYHGNPNLWDVTLEQNSSNICRLADLRDCHICVGGGFPVASLDDTLQGNVSFGGCIDDTLDENAIYNGWTDDGEGDTCQVSFCFPPHATWLTFHIHGWPREEWEPIMRERDYDETRNFVSFLVDDVADQYQYATVEFKHVTFAARSIHGALKRLLPKKRKEEVRADRDRRIAIQEGSDGGCSEDESEESDSSESDEDSSGSESEDDSDSRSDQDDDNNQGNGRKRSHRNISK